MGHHVQQTADSGFVIAAYSSSSDGDVDSNRGLRDAWIIKLSSNGTVQWQRTYGGSANDLALSVRQTADGGYIFAGWTASDDGDISLNQGDEDCWIVKLDTNGNIEWQKTLGGADEDHFTSVIQTADGGYLAAGSVKSNDGDVAGHRGGDDCWIVKFDGQGNVQWKKLYGGSGADHCGDHSVAGAVIETYDGGFIFSGYSNSKDGDVTGNHGEYDCWIVKLDQNGDLLWQRSVGGAKDDEAFYMVQMPDSMYIIAGITNSPNYNISGDTLDYDMWCFKLDQTGSLIWEQSFGGIYKELAFSIDQTADTSVILAGYSRGNNGQVSGYKGGLYDMWVVKLDMPVINHVPGLLQSRLLVHPNPANNLIEVSGTQEKISLSLFSLTGQLLRMVNTSQMQIADIPQGMYLLKVYDEAGVILQQEKIIRQ